MRSWTPRPPSPGIEQYLFRAEHPPHATARRRTQRWSWQSAWAAAAAVCVLFVLTAVNLSRVGGFHSPGVPVNLAALSNATSLAAAQHNCWSAPIFGWTNDRQLPSPIRSFDLLNTNRLLR